LTSSEQLSKLDIRRERNQLPLPLPLNPRKAHYFVFCKTRKSFNGKVLHDERLPLSTLLPLLRIIGEVTGLLQVVRGYVLRYASSKVLNSSGKSSLAEVALRAKGTDAMHIRFSQRFLTKLDHTAL
jgi:Protein of unknown function (DUF3435)